MLLNIFNLEGSDVDNLSIWSEQRFEQTKLPPKLDNLLCAFTLPTTSGWKKIQKNMTTASFFLKMLTSDTCVVSNSNSAVLVERDRCHLRFLMIVYFLLILLILTTVSNCNLIIA